MQVAAKCQKFHVNEEIKIFHQVFENHDSTEWGMVTKYNFALLQNCSPYSRFNLLISIYDKLRLEYILNLESVMSFFFLFFLPFFFFQFGEDVELS